MVLKDHENRFEPEDKDNVAGSVDGRILVKLKLPKNMIINEEEDIIKKNTNNCDHYCVDCERSFTSGKALGGHISSAHVQAKKDHKLKSSNKRKFHQGSGSSLGSDYICKICGKDFLSRKSLFGHMRSHPERNWRGMKSPKKESAEEYSLNDALMINYEDGDNDDSDLDLDLDPDSAEDMSMYLKTSWFAKDKRGRGSLKPNFDSFLDLEEDEQVHAVGYELLRLVNASENTRFEEVKEKGRLELEKEKINRDGSYDRDLHLKVIDLKSKKLEDNKDEPEKIIVDDLNLYICKVCDKVFPTGQALGGHKKCHGTIDKVPSCSIDGSTLNEHKMMNIDLNKIPDQEDDVVDLKLIL